MQDKQTEPAAKGTNTTDSTANWAYTPSDSAQDSQAQPHSRKDVAPITWTASEFMDHNKSAGWYLSLILLAVAVAAGFYVLFRDVITAIVILVAAAALGFYARRKPRQLEYRLDASGLSIEAKHFTYNSFRSFSVIDEGPFGSIVFLPMKRFGLLITVYFDPKDEENIVDLIGEYLPFEPRNQDVIDRFMTRIRF